MPLTALRNVLTDTWDMQGPAAELVLSVLLFSFFRLE